MEILVELAATPLANGKFQPRMTFMHQLEFTPYDIDLECDSYDEAIKAAKSHAIDELKKDYGDTVRVSFLNRKNRAE